MEKSTETPGTTPDMDEDQSEIGDETANEIATSANYYNAGGLPQHHQYSNPNTLAAPTDYSLFSNPPSLGLIRQRLFELEDEVELSPTDFDLYWPFLDNVWGRLRTGAPYTAKENGVTTEWYHCRARKSNKHKPQTPTPAEEPAEGKRTRKKRMRKGVECEMLVKVIHTDGLVKSCKVVRGVEKGIKHSHDLEYLDSVKRNSGIMDTARREAVKGFLPSSIFTKLWKEPDKMIDAGGKFMKVSDVRNVQYHWRQENPSVILRSHDGFASKYGQKVVAAPQAPPMIPIPSHQMVAQRTLPSNTLHYPLHAREFLEPYLPPTGYHAISPRATPHITLTYASSLDSRISLAPGLQTALSGPESKSMTHYLRSRHDAILIGVRTAIADNPSLNCRLEGAGGYGGVGSFQQPRPIIVDPHARLHIHPEMKMLKVVGEGRARAPWIIVAPGAMLHPTAVATLKSHGGEYLLVHDYQPQGPGLNWEGIFGILYNEGIRSIMVEGGGVVMSELLKAQYAHLIDSLIVTIAPTFLGKNGVQVSPDSNFAGEHGQPIASRVSDVKWQPMGVEDVIMCGKIRQTRVVQQQNNGILPGIEEFSQDAPGGAQTEAEAGPEASRDQTADQQSNAPQNAEQ